MNGSPLDDAIAKLVSDGAGDAQQAAFTDHYERLISGDTGCLAEQDLLPLTDPPMLDDQQTNASSAAALSQTAVIRLNGGLGTSMGLAGPKCLLPIRSGMTFLDIVVRQILCLRERHSVRLPLLFMNSYNTASQTLAALKSWPELEVDGLPLDFIQSREPKLLADTLRPVCWPDNPELEWCPPGHGDFYPYLSSSGLVPQLLEAGFRYLFVANIDNLGAVPDPAIADWFARSQAPFAAEITRRTDMDRKGGHLAYRACDHRLVLRDRAQVLPEEMDSFIDITRHTWMNTNNLWFDLEQISPILAQHGGALPLPLIINHKTVDPTDATSPAVLQLESAIGAAIEVFPGAQAIGVPRSRFLPVKATNDLLLLRSDIYDFTRSAHLVASGTSPLIRLDPTYYALIDAFEQRFPQGPPSLLNASSLEIIGDVTFGSGVVVEGDVRICTQEPLHLADGTHLS